jgi:hypothetical protein
MSMLAAALIVTIRVYDLYGLSPQVRQEALAMASEALDHAGVQAIIVDCSPRPAAAACKTSVAEGELVLRILRHPRDGAHVLGEAVVGGANTIATIYAAAIAERSRRHGVPLARVAGRVAAHEIGHLLLGSNAHASHGLMRPSWDLQQLHRGDWDFTREDAATIRRRLSQRGEVLLAARAGA